MNDLPLAAKNGYRVGGKVADESECNPIRSSLTESPEDRAKGHKFEIGTGRKERRCHTTTTQN